MGKQAEPFSMRLPLSRITWLIAIFYFPWQSAVLQVPSVGGSMPVVGTRSMPEQAASSFFNDTQNSAETT